MSTNNAQNMGERIRQLREKKGMTLTDLAREAGISRGYLHLVEKGDSNPTQEKLGAIAAALDVFVSELTGEIETADDLPMQIPPTLREFAKKYNLSPAETAMLSKINYRGKHPETIDQWLTVWSVIKGMLSKD